jgi:hypothetical protein
MTRRDRRTRLRRELTDPACLLASLGKFFVGRPVVFLRESAPQSPKWLKRRLPLLYYHLTLRSLREWIAHVRADAVLVSFPKCGRTWLRTMIDRALLLEYGHTPLRLQVVHEDDPFWKSPAELATTKTEYRHKKVLFLTRDAKDTLVSSYFHKHDRQQLFRGTLADYLDATAGGLETIVEYARIWRANAGVPCGFLEVRYEDLHVDPQQVLGAVLCFLDVPVSAASLADAVEFASFEKMRARELAERGTDVPAESLKAREGRVGGHRARLTPEQIAALDARLASLDAGRRG